MSELQSASLERKRVSGSCSDSPVDRPRLIESGNIGRAVATTERKKDQELTVPPSSIFTTQWYQ